MENFDSDKLNTALSLLNSRISQSTKDSIGLVVCGGSALIATNLVARTTKDVDVLAITDLDEKKMIDAVSLPPFLIKAADEVASTLNLPADWLNSGPADLFRMGLPVGFSDRLIEHKYGQSLTVFYIGRTDQIHFKLYASVDRGGYHIDDLMQLEPSEEEMIQAGLWTQTHDVSEGYSELLRMLLRELGYKHAAEKV